MYESQYIIDNFDEYDNVDDEYEDPLVRVCGREWGCVGVDECQSSVHSHRHPRKLTNPPPPSHPTFIFITLILIFIIVLINLLT